MFKLIREIKFWRMITRFLRNIRYDRTGDIDGVDLLHERLYVRGKDINELIGNITFTDAIFNILLNRFPTETERKIFDSVLVSFHAGFGYSPPTVLLARLSATTGTTVAHALSAGYAGGGKYHVGAIEEAMSFYQDIKKTRNPDLSIKEHVDNYLTKLFEKKETVYGFGHPALKKDPRPERLRTILRDLNYTSEYIEIYDEAAEYIYRKKDLYPNIDGINAAILLSLGFVNDHGVGLFLLARTSDMLAHVVDERINKPFYTEDKIYPILRTLERERSEAVKKENP